MQHLEILRLADTLHVAMTSGTTTTMIADFLRTLEEHLETHLRSEEHLMETLGFDGRADHVQEHNRAREAVRRLREASSAQSMPIAFDTMQFLRDWLRPHLDGPDRKLAAFLRERRCAPLAQACGLHTICLPESR